MKIIVRVRIILWTRIFHFVISACAVFLTAGRAALKYIIRSVQFNLFIPNIMCYIGFTMYVKTYAYNTTHWQHSEECMCRLRNIAMRDYQESVAIGQTDRQTDRQPDAGQSDPYWPLCFAGDIKNKVKNVIWTWWKVQREKARYFKKAAY